MHSLVLLCGSHLIWVILVIVGVLHRVLHLLLHLHLLLMLLLGRIRLHILLLLHHLGLGVCDLSLVYLLAIVVLVTLTILLRASRYLVSILLQ